ncbi:MAG: inner membrane CreD family protein [Treponema sp.]|nr:inner membrane CreD family protein [Treponema sp.]
MKAISAFTSKLIFIGIIIGLLLLANLAIGSKLGDRERERNSAERSVSESAGGSFLISDIFIGIPYTRFYYETDSKGVQHRRSEQDIAVFRAESSCFSCGIKTKNRTLGIYSFPVFTGEMQIRCDFSVSVPESTELCVYDPSHAFLEIQLGDRSLSGQPVFTINGKEYNASLSARSGSSKQNGISAFFPCVNGKNTFQANLQIRGARQFAVSLSSTHTKIEVNSDWKSPSFAGFGYLPDYYDISESGFTAKWEIPFDTGDASHTAGFGFVQPVNVYKMLHRAVNYGFLFIIVPFIVLFLFEIFSDIHLHPFNYLLCGAASIIFFLLLLSLSEHIMFGISYVMSSFASGILVSLYVSSVTKKIRIAAAMSLVFAGMYGYLYASLQSEDYALLIGSVFAFSVLALIMYFTRNVDWSALKIAGLKKSGESDSIKQ